MSPPRIYGRARDGRSSGTGLEGEWAALVVAGPRPQVFVLCAESVVFSAEHRVVASTANLVPELERDLKLTTVVDAGNSSGYFAFGLTPFRGVARLLPNHVLDLLTFTPERDWPPAGWWTDGIERFDAARAVADQGVKVAEAWAKVKPVEVALTAGRDSRSVLAMCRRLVEDPDVSLRTYTERIPEGVAGRTDVAIARRVARRAGVPWSVIDAGEETSPEDYARAFMAIGEAKSGIVLAGAAEGEEEDTDSLTFLGFGGEVGRPFKWPRGSDGAWTVPACFDVDLALRLTVSPDHPRIRAAAQRWVDEVDHSLPVHVLMTLNYLESRLGGWAAPQRYLPIPGQPPVSPMLTTPGIEAMVALREEDKVAETCQADVIALLWPELLSEPFNTPRGVAAHVERMRAGVRRMGRPIARRLRGR